MSETEPPRIVAAITSEAQRAAIVAAAEQLSYCVGTALAADWPLRLRLIDPDEAEIPAGMVLVAWMETPADAETLAATQGRWAARLQRYRSAGHERVLLCNLFRGGRPRDESGEGVARIRRFNQLVVGLSRELGVEVVDVDRLLALCGARTIAAAVRGADAATAQLAGHAIADAILEGDLGEAVDATAQQRASAVHGGVRDIPALIARHLRTEGVA